MHACTHACRGSHPHAGGRGASCAPCAPCKRPSAHANRLCDLRSCQVPRDCPVGPMYVPPVGLRPRPTRGISGGELPPCRRLPVLHTWPLGPLHVPSAHLQPPPPSAPSAPFPTIVNTSPRAPPPDPPFERVLHARHAAQALPTMQHARALRRGGGSQPRGARQGAGRERARRQLTGGDGCCVPSSYGSDRLQHLVKFGRLTYRVTAHCLWRAPHMADARHDGMAVAKTVHHSDEVEAALKR